MFRRQCTDGSNSRDPASIWVRRMFSPSTPHAYQVEQRIVSRRSQACAGIRSARVIAATKAAGLLSPNNQGPYIRASRAARRKALLRTRQLHDIAPTCTDTLFYAQLFSSLAADRDVWRP